MASDNRDWYSDWWRKKTGYVERASFRISEADHQRVVRSRAWRSIWIKLAIFFACVVVVRFILKR